VGINAVVARAEYHVRLEQSFSATDWQYLCQNDTFKGLLSVSDDTADDFEFLIEVASVLLQRRDDLVWFSAVYGIRSTDTPRQS
jgi:hypothetical protein